MGILFEAMCVSDQGYATPDRTKKRISNKMCLAKMRVQFYTHAGEFYTHPGEFDRHQGKFDTHRASLTHGSASLCCVLKICALSLQT